MTNSSSSSENDMILKQIGDLQDSLQELRKTRQMARRLMLVCVLIIVGAICFMCMNLYNYGKNYDTKKLITLSAESVKELQTNPDLALMKEDLIQKHIPALVETFQNKFEKNQPVMQELATNSALKVRDYIKDAVIKHFVASFSKDILDEAKSLSAEYNDIDVSKVMPVLENSALRFQLSLAEVLEKNIQKMFNELDRVDVITKKLSEKNKYPELQKHNISLVEGLFVKTLVEILYYEIEKEMSFEIKSAQAVPPAADCSKTTPAKTK